MEIIKGFDNPALQPTRRVVADGSFDGMHLGHRAVFDAALRAARELGAPLTALTFEPAPVEVFGPSGSRNVRLALARERGLEQLGVDTLVIANFNEELRQISAEQFAREYIVERLGTVAVVLSESHSWGRNAEADSSRIQELGSRYGFGVRVIPLITLDGEVISSSTIRNFLWAGKIGPANRLLGHPYALYGLPQPGAGRGRAMGFPTINLRVPAAKLVPGPGVYSAVVEADGLPEPPVTTYPLGWPAAVSVGAAPTFEPDGDPRTVEVHLLGINVDDSGGAQGMMVHFLDRLRDQRAFASEEELKTQIHADVDRLRRQFRLPTAPATTAE